MSSEPRSAMTHGPASDQSLLLILSAPSGTGKTTLAHRLVNENPGAVFSVSCTTREVRGTEKNGVDYHFIDEAEFLRMMQSDLFVEWAEVHGNFYGTPRSVVDDAKAFGRLAIFDIDVQGGEQIKKRFPEAVTVLVLPPSYEELARRLRARGTDGDGVVQRRLLAAQSEIRRGRSYDYIIVNDSLDRALDDLRAIVRAERGRTSRYDLAALGY